MTAVADKPVKRLLLSLPRVLWVPRCDECGAEVGHDVRSKSYVRVTQKKGYKLKEHKHGRLCRSCDIDVELGDFKLFEHIGIDLAAGPDLMAGYVYAPYIPEGLLGAGRRKQQ